MYHVELRHFPHNMSRFNLGDAELHAIVEPWARGQVIEFGEHRWNPREAKLTIIEGPNIPLGQLTMGRGWRTAERQGTDVTQRVLDTARQALFAAREPGGGAPAHAHAATPGSIAAPPSDPLTLGMQLGALLGPDAVRLLDAWRAAVASSPGLAPSESLAQAERAVRSGGGVQG